MPAFTATDGTELAYHVAGEGEPLLCLPGGPMRASAYLGDLGGLARRRRLVMLDLRGTGDSGIPADRRRTAVTGRSPMSRPCATTWGWTASMFSRIPRPAISESSTRPGIRGASAPSP
jgi:pimeloyl-ACP methyl ester carboxylesterase